MFSGAESLSLSEATSRGGQKVAFGLLWINLATAFLILVLLTVMRISGAREILRVLGCSFVYANITGLIAMTVVNALATRPGLRRLSRIPVLLLGVVLCTALGCLLAQALLVWMHFGVPTDFWP